MSFYKTHQICNQYALNPICQECIVQIKNVYDEWREENLHPKLCGNGQDLRVFLIFNEARHVHAHIWFHSLIWISFLTLSFRRFRPCTLKVEVYVYIPTYQGSEAYIDNPTIQDLLKLVKCSWIWSKGKLKNIL